MSRLLTLAALLMLASPALAAPIEPPVDTAITAVPKVVINSEEEYQIHLLPPVAPAPPPVVPQDILIHVEETRTGSLLFGVGVNSDAGLSCCTEEVPVDGLLLAAVAHEEPACPYQDLLIDLFVPPMRLRHLTPSRVKETVEELKPCVLAAFERWDAFLGRCFGEDNTPSALYLQHKPQYIPPTPDFPLSRELATMQVQEAANPQPPVDRRTVAPVCPYCPLPAQKCQQGDTEESEDADEDDVAEAEEDDVQMPSIAEEQEAKDDSAGEESYEVQITVKDLRTGKVICMPKMVLLSGKAGFVNVKSAEGSVRAEVEVTGPTKSASVETKPCEPEQLEIMPREAKDETGEEQESGIEEKPVPMTAPAKPSEPCPPAACPKSAEDVTCPYLQQQKEPHEATTSADELFKDSVLDNLEKLIQARKAFHKAERAHHEGDPVKACFWYEKVIELCPGSRFDRMATERLHEITAEEMGEKISTPDADESEETPPADEEQSPECCTDCMLSALKMLHVEQCPLFKSVTRMGPMGGMMCPYCDCSVSCFLLWKAHAFVPLPKGMEYPGCCVGVDCETEDEDVAPANEAKGHSFKDLEAALFIARLFQTPIHDEKAAKAVAKFFSRLQKHEEPVTTSSEPDGDTETSEPAPVPPASNPQPYDVRIQPSLPPIDPKVVDALEKVLRESGDPARPKFIIAPEDVPATDDSAEQEEAVSQWPYVAPEQEIPTLFIDPDADLELGGDEDRPANPPTPDSEQAGEVLQQALEALKQGLYVDIDTQDGTEGVTLQVGGVEFRVGADTAGHKFFIVGLIPEERHDIKAIHRALYERVMRWIENMNNGGNKYEEPTEEEEEDLYDLDTDVDPVMAG